MWNSYSIIQLFKNKRNKKINVKFLFNYSKMRKKMREINMKLIFLFKNKLNKWEK